MTEWVEVSLFAGIGGFSLAARRNGIRSVAAVEIDPDSRAVYRHHFPEATIFDDVRTVTGDDLRNAGADPARTILTAGFPCQDLSVAGRRAGLDQGTRSGLYWEIDRLLGEFAPAWVILENVPGLLSSVCPCPGDGACARSGLAVRCPGGLHPVPGGLCGGQCIARHGGAMGAVLGSLGVRGYGYAARVLDSQLHGVPQRRRRVYVVGRRAGGPGWTGPAQVLLEPAGCGWGAAAGIPARPASTAGPRCGAGGRSGTGGASSEH